MEFAHGSTSIYSSLA